MGRIKAPKLVLAGIGDAGRILDKEGELLCQSPPHDRVILVEAERTGLACQQLLFDERCEQVVHLLARWSPLPLIGKGFPQPADLSLTDSDRPFGLCCRRAAVQPFVAAEQQGASDQEMEQRLSERFHAASPVGVEVHQYASSLCT
jgi:hypothetical protein